MHAHNKTHSLILHEARNHFHIISTIQSYRGQNLNIHLYSKPFSSKVILIQRKESLIFPCSTDSRGYISDDDAIYDSDTLLDP